MTRILSTLLLPLLLVLATPPRAAFAFTVPVAASFSTAVPADRQSVIALQGSDAEGTSLVYATTSSPSHGALSSLNTATGYVVYTPTSGYVGADSFNYTVTSGGETSTAGTVTITVTNAKTTITDTITDPSGAPRSGKVTFILTQAVTTPAGLSPVGASVSAALNSSGTFTAQLYPSRSMNPAAYYQVYYNSGTSQELLGVYDIPASTTVVTLSTTKVTDTNLAARYTFASAAGVAALTGAVAAAVVPSQIFPSVTSGNLPYYNGSTFANSGVSQSGSTTTVTGDLDVTGDFLSMPDAPGYKVSGTQVVGAQGTNIADPDESVASNTETLKAVLAHLRGWGALSNLYRSTLNDGLISLWLMNNVNDSAGSNHLTNNSSVTFTSAGANFSGSNHLSIANNASLQIDYRQSFTVAARVRLSTKATTQALVSKTDGASANEFLLAYVSAGDGHDRFRFAVYPGGTTITLVSASTFGSPSTATDYLVTGWYNSQSNQVCIAIDDGAADCAAATVTSHAYTSQLAIGSLSVPTASARLNGSIRFVGFWNRVLAAEERKELDDNGAALAYPLKDDTTTRTEFVLQPYHFWDSRASAYAGAEALGYFYALPYSRVIFTTAATSMDVEVYGNEPDVPGSARQINVRVNGADFALPVPAAAAGVTTHTVSLPVGQKTVEVWTPFQALFSGVVKGTWLRKVTFNQAAQVKTPSNKTPHLVVYGDSISAGAGATETPRGAWPMLLRDAYPGSVAVEAWGGRSLFQDAVDGTARALFVQRVVTQQPDAFFSLIGTNDYGGTSAGEQSAADFGADYGALLDDLHTARPSMAVYVMSPIPRTTETANSFGNTLSQYRTQAQTVCAARSWCTFIDGSAVTGFNTGTDLYDVVHPNDSGHTKVANYVKAFFGL